MGTGSSQLLYAYGADDGRLPQAAPYPSLSLGRVVSLARGHDILTAPAGECAAQVSGRFRHRQLENAKLEAMLKEAGGMKKARRFQRGNNKRGR